MRLFIAVDVPGDVKDAVEQGVVGPLRDAVPGAKWTRPEGRHLTLKFLGRVDDARSDEISAALRGAVGAIGAFEAAFGEVGGFPNLRRPRVLWVGIGPGCEALAGLASAIEAAFVPLGFEPEDRPHRPHLTLARFPKPQVIGPLPPVQVPEARFEVAEVALFRSDLHPKGARYTVMDQVGLAH